MDAAADPAPPAADRSIRAVLWQITPGRFPTAAEQQGVFDLRPDLVVLPEYYAVRGQLPPPRSFVDFDRNVDQLRALAVRLKCAVVGGTIVEKESRDLFNTCFVFDRRIHVGFYRKMHLTERELAAGLSPGSVPRIVTAAGISIGLLICADALHPESFDALRGADVVAIPTSSPYRPDDTDEERERRDQEIFVAGAARVGAFVLKACAAGNLAGTRLQGRSLVAAPWGIIDRVPFAGETGEATLVVDLPLGELRRRRQG